MKYTNLISKGINGVGFRLMRKHVKAFQLLNKRSWRKAVVSQAPEAERWTKHSNLNRMPTAGHPGCVYVARRVLLIAIVLPLLPVVAPAAPAWPRSSNRPWAHEQCCCSE